MFTGIVETTGSVERIDQTAKGIRLGLRAGAYARGIRVSDSLAVNGCCLTVVKNARGGRLEFDLLKETWERTNLQYVAAGGVVNLERPLRANAELGGHFVTGHIDGVGRIVRWERSGADHLLDIQPPAELMPYIVFKGSIAVDGISLTVAAVDKKTFRIWIIPHTYEITNLREHKVGSAVNLETDIIGKYVERFVSPRLAALEAKVKKSQG